MGALKGVWNHKVPTFNPSAPFRHYPIRVEFLGETDRSYRIKEVQTGAVRTVRKRNVKLDARVVDLSYFGEIRKPYKD